MRLMLTIRKKLKGDKPGQGKILYQRVLEPVGEIGHAWYDNLDDIKGNVEIILEPYIKGVTVRDKSFMV